MRTYKDSTFTAARRRTYRKDQVNGIQRTLPLSQVPDAYLRNARRYVS